MKKSQRLAAALCLWSMLLTGCKTANVPDEISKTTVAIEENGQIRYWLTGVFDHEYYRISELNQMAVEEAHQFNAGINSESSIGTEQTASEKQYPVVVEAVKRTVADENTVMVQYLFDGWKSYTSFNEEDLFYGTVGEAKKRGYAIGAEFLAVKNDGIYSAEEVIRSDEKYIIITNVKADIYFPGKAAYMSVGVHLNEDGSVNTAEAKGLVSILLK